jgi:hypothetical protein
LTAISKRVHELAEEQQLCFLHTIMPQFTTEGIHLVRPSLPLFGESLTLFGCCAVRERLVMQPDGRCVRAKTDGSNGLRSQERLYELAAVDRSRTGIDSSA